MCVNFTMCFLKLGHSATCVLMDEYIVFHKRVYTEGAVFMKPAEFQFFLTGDFRKKVPLATCLQLE